jgi:NTE family protein
MSDNGTRDGLALVLGGGGALGVAWETGLLAGLLEAGIDAGASDLVVGTSAGSIVGTMVANGRLDVLVSEQSAPDDGRLLSLLEVDLAEATSLFVRWAGLTEVTRDTMAEIGRMALAAKTTSEERWVGYFRDALPLGAWPERPLMLTAVEAATGAFQTWDRDSGVQIEMAVASSCSVPGLFPPVTIKGKRYTDGGVRSGTSADLAAGYGSVLIVAPMGAREDGIDPLLGRQARAEADALRRAGSRVELVFPDAASLDAMGINRMDASRRGQCLGAGMQQGKALATRMTPDWARA